MKISKEDIYRLYCLIKINGPSELISLHDKIIIEMAKYFVEDDYYVGFTKIFHILKLSYGQRSYYKVLDLIDIINKYKV